MRSKLEKHTLRLRDGDVEFLRDRFPTVPVNVVIRQIISGFVDRQRASRETPDLPEETINV